MYILGPYSDYQDILFDILSASFWPKPTDEATHLRRRGLHLSYIHRVSNRHNFFLHTSSKRLESDSSRSLSASAESCVQFWRIQCGQRYIRCLLASSDYLESAYEAVAKIEDLDSIQSRNNVRLFEIPNELKRLKLVNAGPSL